MANKFPLILNTSANQIQEIASGDNLDLTGCGINNAGVITATSFSGNGSGLIGVASTDYIVTGTAATFNNTTNFNGNVNISSNIDVDGHTNLDNVSIAGVTTMSGNITATGNLTISNTAPWIQFTDTNTNPDWLLQNSNGAFVFHDGTATRLQLNTDGHVDVTGNLDVGAGVDVTGNVVASGNVSGVDGTFTGNVSIGGTLTYEDVTNIDSVGLITARNGINVSAGTATFQGAIDANSDLDVDGHTNLDNVSIAGVVTATTFVGNGDFVELDVDGHTNLDNVSIAGVTTFTGAATLNGNTTFGADVTFGGASSATALVWDKADDDLKLAAATQLHIGDSSEFKAYRSGTHTYLAHTNSNGNFFIQSQANIALQAGGSTTGINVNGNGEVTLCNSGNIKLATTGTGINITGICTATTFSGSGASLTNVNATTLDNIDSTNFLRSNTADSMAAKLTLNQDNDDEKLVLAGTSNPYIRWQEGTTNKAYIQWHSDGYLKIGNDEDSSQIRIKDTFDFSPDNSTFHTVVHAGNVSTYIGISTEQVTPSSNVATLNLAKDDHKIVASGTYTVNVNGGTEAGSHTLRIENSGTANVGFSTYFKFPSGGTPSLPTASGAISLISFTVHKVGSVGIATVLLAGASVNYS